MNSGTTTSGDSLEQIRVLAIDKTAVLAHVRDRWDRLSAHQEIDLALLSPDSWIENFRTYRFTSSDAYHFKAVVGKVIGIGRELKAIYRSGLFKAFRQTRPEVVLMFEESFSFFALQTLIARRLFAPNARLVFYSNNVTSYKIPGYRLSRLYRAIARIVTPRCDVGLCVNDAAERVLREAGYGIEIRTLFYGIDERRFAPVERIKARNEVGLSPDQRVLLYAGRLIELKGVQDLIAAFEGLYKRRPDDKLKLLIVGDGPYREALLQQANALDAKERIEFRQVVPIESMPTLIGACDMLVLPSRKEFNEQFGRVNAETMLCGTTIVASTSGAIPKVLGENGFVFEAGNVEELTEKIIYILEHPGEAEDRRTKGRAYALKHYSTQAAIRNLLQLIKDMTGER
ncbi:MAG: glycosyltransferase family 4 protein [Chlorobi bacterium]|nr:glycosyltransferase family 4 protein [Chlorobiota bacterium]